MAEAEYDKVTVAFIDSTCAVDSYHRFSEVLWQNENEIADNNIDDDKNRYVDDINGWNYVYSGNSSFTENEYNHCDYVLQAFENIVKRNSKVNYEIILLSIMGREGECSIENLIAAIKYAEKNGAQICNLSLSTYNNYPELKEILEASDMLFVVAAGNEGENLDKGFPSYPSNYKLENVISVAAADECGNLLEMSNYGENTVDVAVNGIIRSQHQLVEGTSISTAKVTAIAVIQYNITEVKVSAGEYKKIVIGTIGKKYKMI